MGADRSVAFLEMDFDGDGVRDSFCTAFPLGGGEWVTAGHCLDHPGSRTLAGRPVTDVAISDTHDVAVFHSGAEGRPLRTGALPGFGERVVAVGYPGTVEDGQPHLGAHEGLVGQYEGGLIQFSAPLVPGISGGPLLDAGGRVIGVVVAAYQGRPISYAVPVRYALDLVAQRR